MNAELVSFFFSVQSIFTSIPACCLVSHPAADVNRLHFTPHNPTQCAGVNAYIVYQCCPEYKDSVGVSRSIEAVSGAMLKPLFLCVLHKYVKRFFEF